MYEEIKSQIKEYPNEERIQTLRTTEYYKEEFHDKINKELTDLIPNTHIVASPDDFIHFSIDQQKTIFGPNDKFIKMKENNCHNNCLLLYLLKKVKSIYFGYALSEDGLWRFHSWCVDNNNNTIETTEPRLMYYGIERVIENEI